MILAGDIGATKSDLGLFEVDSDGVEEVASARAETPDEGGIERIVSSFLDDNGIDSGRVEAACFGVAGPVSENRSEPSNLAYAVDGDELSDALGIGRVRVVNDLVATAEGIPGLGDDQLEVVSPADVDPEGHRAVIAPGTGLGMSVVAHTADGWLPLPSEGGHVDFAPQTDEQIELYRFLAAELDHVSVERVASGLGLANLYRFLTAHGGRPDPETERRLSASGEDPTPAITRGALEHSCPVCERAVGLLVDVLGAAAGNLALTAIPTGGLYVGGGMAIRLREKLADGRFRAAFLAKGRFRDLLEQIRVAIILEHRVALLGAAAVAARAAR